MSWGNDFGVDDVKLRKEAETPNKTGEVDADFWARKWAHAIHKPVEEVKEYALIKQMRGE